MISVIMPCTLQEYEGGAKKRKEKLDRALKSFLAQDYPDKEILVISDGCMDTIQFISDNYNHEPSIRTYYLSKQELFSGNVRDFGLKRANGDYITYLDSVTGDRCVPVKIGDKIDVIPMEDLFEKFKFLSYYSGEKEVIDIPSSLEIYTLTPDKITTCDFDNVDSLFNNHFSKEQHKLIKHLNTNKRVFEIANEQNENYFHVHQRKTYINKRMDNGIYHISGKWTKINKLIRHFVIDKSTYQVTQKVGQTEITKDHSLIDIVDGKYIEVNFDAFKDKPFHTISTIPVNIIDTFKLSDYLHCSNYDLTGGKLNSKGRDGENYIVNDYNEEDKILSLMRLLGFYVAEGSTSSRTTSKTLALDNNNIKILEVLRTDINNISNVHTQIGEIKKKSYASTFRLRVYNKLFTHIFPEICGTNCKNKKIPSFIFSLKKKYIDEFIKYMYLGDGHYNQNGYWSYTTTSLRLISGLSVLLKIIGKDHTLVYRKENKSWQLIERRDGAVIRANPKKFEVIESNKPQFVYDIQVSDENHIFVDACGCLLLHNSDDLLKDKDHLTKIVAGFKNPHADWIYFDDYVKYFELEHLPLAPREAKLTFGNIGVSNIAHRNFKDITWDSCNGYGHDYQFVTRLIDQYKTFKKIEGTSYVTCHIQNGCDT